MTLTHFITNVLDEYQAKARKKSVVVDDITIATPHGWDFEVSFNLGNKGKLTIKHITDNHLAFLKEFKNQLSGHSRFLIPCYPWEDNVKLDQALRQAINKVIDKVDASYLIETQGKPIGHFFLWKAGGNPHSLPHGVDIPELGVAIADEYQGHGLGRLSVNLLQAIAHSLSRDAIELTTVQSNDAGWHIYLKSGFEYTGDINNPLEVDVTDAFAGAVEVPRSRVERQMIYIINQDKKSAILDYLAHKRQEADKF